MPEVLQVAALVAKKFTQKANITYSYRIAVYFPPSGTHFPHTRRGEGGCHFSFVAVVD